jgi:hypothetical protein
MEPITASTARRLARIAGGLYLINIVGGAFAIGVIPAMLIVTGDVSATAHNIRSQDFLYRSGLVAHIVILVTNVIMSVIFWDLFKVVNRRVAMLAVLFGILGTAVEAGTLLNQFVPLVLLGSGPAAGALPASEAQGLTYVSVALSEIGYSIYSAFFGFLGICLGYLVFRSTFLPRIIGVLLVLGGFSYLSYGFVDLLAPGLAAHLVPWIQLPALIGEGSFALWLLAASVNARRWTERTARPRVLSPSVPSPATV